MYYFLQIQALQRWTLMYVIRFSKIVIAQVSSGLIICYTTIFLSTSCQEK